MGQTWGSIRKKLEKEYICDSLKGRIQYFITRYHKAGFDKEGRVAIRFDGKEIVKSSFFMREVIRYDIWKSNEPDWNTTMKEVHKAGGFDVECFYAAFKFYQNHSIAESLYSDDPLIRLLAVLDKRVGKRTLKELVSKIETQPEWLQRIYNLRLEAEGILSKNVL